ncbi:MAG TPA: hypothetical protein VNU26_17790, partial [Mycobacteriales bacterium]|nr:hypothetical protein [Mycobacteriales bacterium]
WRKPRQTSCSDVRLRSRTSLQEVCLGFRHVVRDVGGDRVRSREAVLQRLPRVGVGPDDCWLAVQPTVIALKAHEMTPGVGQVLDEVDVSRATAGAAQRLLLSRFVNVFPVVRAAPERSCPACLIAADWFAVQERVQRPARQAASDGRARQSRGRPWVETLVPIVGQLAQRS